MKDFIASYSGATLTRLDLLQTLPGVAIAWASRHAFNNLTKNARWTKYNLALAVHRWPTPRRVAVL